MRWTLFGFASMVIGTLNAQVLRQKHNTTGDISFREVSGIVLDSSDVPVAGALIHLKSHTDSLETITNEEGIFMFKKVKAGAFYLNVRSLGINPVTIHSLNNNTMTKIVLDPIRLTTKSRLLNEVEIDGTPAVIYKTDTVEYRAVDYKVREHARIDELLKKMEGMEVGRDGTLTYNGQLVSQARLNGNKFLDGSVANTIENLPAEIVEKIQIIDDYGEEAARTGIKNGVSRKVLNIATKADKSIGNMVRLSLGAGNKERYDTQVFATRINANETIGINSRLFNTITGIADPVNQSAISMARGGNEPGSLSGNSGGNTKAIKPMVSYSNALTRKTYVNFSYGYDDRHLYTTNKSNQQQFNALGTTFSTRDNKNNNTIRNHNVSLSFEYDIDTVNFIRVSSSLNFDKTVAEQHLSDTRLGLIHQQITGANGSESTLPKVGGVVFYQHLFSKPRRNFTLQLNSNASRLDHTSERHTNIHYYEGNSDLVLKDSLVQRRIANNNMNRNYGASTTFTEPLGKYSQLQINARINYRGYDNDKTTSEVIGLDVTIPIDSLSSIYNYSFTEARLALAYQLSRGKYDFSLGMDAIPTILKGEKDRTTTYRTAFNLVPIFRFRYKWTGQQQIQVRYFGQSVEPNFQQLQPVRDVSNPQNPIVGNPNLAASFRNTVIATYNHYIANAQFNYSININSVFIDNQVVPDMVLIEDAYNSLKYETHFSNLDGTYLVNANYSLSKQFANRKYYISLNGSVNTFHTPFLSNGQRNIATAWQFTERLGPRVQPLYWIEVSPYISYDLTKSTNTIPSFQETRTHILAFNVDGKIYPTKSLEIGCLASKNYSKGIRTMGSKNPFVVNAYIEKRFLNKFGASLRIEAFDVFNQNKFINRVVNEAFIIDTQTNSLSRYFMISFIMNLQKWSGVPKREGVPIPRRGDGSFIK